MKFSSSSHSLGMCYMSLRHSSAIDQTNQQVSISSSLPHTLSNLDKEKPLFLLLSTTTKTKISFAHSTLMITACQIHFVSHAKAIVQKAAGSFSWIVDEQILMVVMMMNAQVKQ